MVKIRILGESWVGRLLLHNLPTPLECRASEAVTCFWESIMLHKQCHRNRTKSNELLNVSRFWAAPDHYGHYVDLHQCVSAFIVCPHSVSDQSTIMYVAVVTTSSHKTSIPRMCVSISQQYNVARFYVIVQLVNKRNYLSPTS